VELTFRAQHFLPRTGQTVNVPANAPHPFTNASGRAARLPCACSAPGPQEGFFFAAGDPVATRTAPPPELDEAAKAPFIARPQEPAPRNLAELLPP
jgi:hypothetical protein